MTHFDTFIGWLVYNESIKLPMHRFQLFIGISMAFALVTDVIFPYFAHDKLTLITHPDFTLGRAFLLLSVGLLGIETLWLLIRWLLWLRKWPLRSQITLKKRNFQ